MSIKGFYLLPHPPIVIPEVGKGEEKKISATTDSFHKIGKDIRDKAPSTIIIITPHGFMYSDAVALAYEDKLSGDFAKFNAFNVLMSASINKELTQRVYELAYGEAIPCGLVTKTLLDKHRITFELDHGAMVPLYFVNQYYKDYKLVHITYGPISDIDLYKLGMQINNAVNMLDENAVIIASGDLSHKLKAEGPYGYDPAGEKFDKEFILFLEKGDAVNALNIDKQVICNAAECGRRSVAILLGTLEGKKFEGELLSYEGPFGVGYGVMKLKVIGENISILEKLESLQKDIYEKKTKQTNPYVRLARESLTTYLSDRQGLKYIPSYVTDEMRNTKRGVFVSMKKHGELRGCIGTIFPTTNSIAEEIIRNAIEAGINDPRFYEVQADELMDIDFSVDVLTEPEPTTKEELDPSVYGVIVRTNTETGLLLPDLEGVDTVDKQLSIALQKAGIRENEAYKIERFKVIRHKEE